MQWAPPHNPAVYLAIGAAVLIALFLARRTAISPSLRSIWLFIPRAAVLGLVLFILFNPVQQSARQLPPRRPQVSCLIDSSRSMGLDRPTSRLEQAKQIVVDSQVKLDAQDGAELQLFRFGARFSSVPTLADLRAEDDASHLGRSLQSLAGLFHEAPEAVIVFSDGQVEDSDQLAQITEDLHAIGVPVHVFPLGDEDIQGDIAIERLSVPRGAKAGDQVPVRVSIRSQGFRGQRVQLQVRPTTSPDQNPLAELPITLASGSQWHDLVVPADPRAGELMLSVPIQKDEAIVSNNQVPFELFARDRRIRVLYMEGTIHGAEYRYVRDALQDDANIECVALTVDDQYVNRPRLARVDDPYRGFPTTRKELFEYDVVICSDISRGAFTREQLDWTAELVNQRGGGFVMVGGYTSFGAGNWDQTVWDRLIPIDMRGGKIGQGFVNQRFKVHVPQAARSHPIWRIVEDREQNNRILDSMPPFYGTNLAKRVKPAATLLGQSDSQLAIAGISPVFACESYGRGRTFAMLPDTTESWGRDFEKYWGENDNRYFRKFWRNVVNWLTENSVSAQRRLVATTDKLIYRPGEPIQLAVQAYDEQYKPTRDYRVEARILDAPEYSQSMSALKVSGDRYRGSVTAVVPRSRAGEEASTLSRLSLELIAWNGAEEIEKRVVALQILNDSDELLTPNPNRDSLVKLAQATEGQVVESVDDLVEALSDLQATPGKRAVHRTPLWDHPALWLGMLGLVVSEWIMRRLSGGRRG